MPRDTQRASITYDTSSSKYRRHTDPNGEYEKIKWNRIKDSIILNRIGLYYSLQYKPSSGAEWKNMREKKNTVANTTFNKNTWQ